MKIPVGADVQCRILFSWNTRAQQWEIYTVVGSSVAKAATMPGDVVIGSWGLGQAARAAARELLSQLPLSE